MLHHFDSRERLLEVAAWWTGRARLHQIDQRAYREGAAAFLPAPRDDEDLITARAWVAWCELWRSEDSLAEPIASIRDKEYLLLARVLDVRPDDPQLSHLSAVIDGLRVALSAPLRPMRPEQARAILAAVTPSPRAP
jgi:hypothetical protein